MTLYRSMRADENGLPVIEKKRWGLGVRVSGLKPDVDVRDGMVRPMGGGMSVARDWRDLLEDFIPVELGGTSTKEKVFSLVEDALPEGLHVRQRGRKGHFQVEPRHIMPIEEYEALLQATHRHWRLVRP